MIEIVIGMAVLSVISGAALISIQKVRSVSVENKLTSDIAVLNSAVQTYRSMGGKFSSNATFESVLGALKSVGTRQNIPGYSGTLVDDRLTWRIQSAEEAASDKPRVFWNNASQRFEISYQGDPGIALFDIWETNQDESMQVATAGTQLESPFTYGKSSGWIWDYDEEPVKNMSAYAPTQVALAGSFKQIDSIPVSLEVVSNSPIDALQPPIVTFPGGAGSEEVFAISILLQNPNPSDSSDIMYSIDYGPWEIFNGTPINLKDGELIATKTNSKDSSKWSDSQITSQNFGALLSSADNTQTASLPVEIALADQVQISSPSSPLVSAPAEGLISSPQTSLDFSVSSGDSAPLGSLSLSEAQASESSPAQMDLILPPEHAVTLSFGDAGVDFTGTGNHYFFNIGGSSAKMGLNITSSSYLAAFESSDATGNGETGAFWITQGQGTAGASIAMDFSENPASQVGFTIYFVNHRVNTIVKAVAQTDQGNTIGMPTITRNANVQDSSSSTRECNFSAPVGEAITSVKMKWDQSSDSNEAYGVGLGEIKFTFQPEGSIQSLTLVSQ